MAFIDGENGENFMTALGFPQYGNPKILESKVPTTEKCLTQKLIELEQEIKELKERIKKLITNFYIIKCPYCGHKHGVSSTEEETNYWNEHQVSISCLKCGERFAMSSPNLYEGTKSEVLNQN